MHFYHLHIITATSTDVAKEFVEGNMQGYEGQVYDYFNIQEGSLGYDRGVIRINETNMNAVWKDIERKMQHTKDSYNYIKDILIKTMRMSKTFDLFAIEIDKPVRSYEIGYLLRCFGGFISNYLLSETFFYDWDNESPFITKDEFFKSVKEGELYAVEIDIHN